MFRSSAPTQRPLNFCLLASTARIDFSQRAMVEATPSVFIARIVFRLERWQSSRLGSAGPTCRFIPCFICTVLLNQGQGGIGSTPPPSCRPILLSARSNSGHHQRQKHESPLSPRGRRRLAAGRGRAYTWWSLRSISTRPLPPSNLRCFWVARVSPAIRTERVVRSWHGGVEATKP